MRKISTLLSLLCVTVSLDLSSEALAQTGSLATSTAPAAVTRQSSSLKVWDDGTAFVVGEVEEDPLPCNQDGTCYLKLRIHSAEVQVIYSIGRIRFYPANNQPHLDLPQKFRKADRIKAFGAFNKAGQTLTISTSDTPDYFIRYASDPTPAGPVTNKFFEEVGRLKSESARNDFEEAKKTADGRRTKMDNQGKLISRTLLLSHIRLG